MLGLLSAGTTECWDYGVLGLRSAGYSLIVSNQEMSEKKGNE